MKVAVFVALEEELDVLIKQLELKRTRPHVTGAIDEVAIDVICPREMGRVAAAVAISKYLGDGGRPDLIICAGLAGGFTVKQGGVICADVVIDLANRKVTDDEDGAAQSKFRRRDFSCSKAIYEVAKSNEFDEKAWADHCCDKFDWPKGMLPSLWEGKLASVDEVVASNAHTKKMTDSVEKLLGVEMEAGGVCAAAQAFKIPYAVLRVVSDCADPAKADDNWRKIGMKTLAELLKRLPLARVIEAAKQ